jgi:hypothetical protein
MANDPQLKKSRFKSTKVAIQQQTKELKDLLEKSWKEFNTPLIEAGKALKESEELHAKYQKIKDDPKRNEADLEKAGSSTSDKSEENSAENKNTYLILMLPH